MKRAQGRPGACCTRGLMCRKTHALVHMSIQVQRKHSGLPCATALRRIRALPGDPAFLTPLLPEKRELLRERDADPEASGPHDFVVRLLAPRSRASLRPPRPVPTSVTTADVPSWRDRMRIIIQMILTDARIISEK